MKIARLALFAALLLGPLPGSAAWNDPNVEGTKEYRLIKLYPQAHVDEYATKDYDSARMLIAYNPASDSSPAVFDDIEGKVIHYGVEHKPTASVLEIYRNYETVLRANGFEPIISGRANKYPALGLGDDDMIGYWRWEEPGKGMIWLSIRAWYWNGAHDQPRSELNIVETATMQQVLEANAATEVKAISLGDTLKAEGHVAVYGITFDFNKATLRPEAAPVLGQVQALLTGDPTLTLAIEGHTDSVGLQAYNQKLSADRAEAVKAWLVAHGIDAARLTAAGFGDSRPVADNAAEDGRAKNRRVELARH